MFFPCLCRAANTSLEQTPSKDQLLQSLPTLISLNRSGSTTIRTDCLFEGHTICTMFILGLTEGGREGGRGVAKWADSQSRSHRTQHSHSRNISASDEPREPVCMGEACMPQDPLRELLQDGKHISTAWRAPPTAAQPRESRGA